MVNFLNLKPVCLVTTFVWIIVPVVMFSVDLRRQLEGVSTLISGIYRLIPALVFTIMLTFCQGQAIYAEYGPPPKPLVQQVSRGEVTRVFMATAYCHTGNRTKTGTWPQVGRTVAVDPRVIPLGSRVWVEGHGWRVAEDTGGLIRGNMLDLYMGSEAEAIQWGRREVRVVIRE